MFYASAGGIRGLMASIRASDLGAKVVVAGKGNILSSIAQTARSLGLF
jgi:hypothetical protein